MNIFACDNSPMKAALCLPDKHVIKMTLESCQMLAVACGQHGYDLGTIRKIDGTPYADTAFRNHPCNVWVRSSFSNLAWLIVHAQSLAFEYSHRYGKLHACHVAIGDAANLFSHTGFGLGIYCCHDEFARAMPDALKHDTSINSVTAYRRFLVAHKPWAAWKKDPSRQPAWWS